jgi:hypothetical protein
MGGRRPSDPSRCVDSVMLRAVNSNSTVSIKRALRQPAGVSEYAQSVFKAVLKLPTCRDPELQTLRDNYEGDHEQLIADQIQKPPPWSDETWNYVRKDLLHVNSTRTSLTTLQSGIYSGPPVRKLAPKKSEKPGPFLQQLNDELATPEWKASAKRLNKEASHYGTSYCAPDYDKESREFRRRHLNPVTTHILVNATEPEVPMVVAEFDEQRNWVRIWTTEFYAVLARDADDVEFEEWVDAKGEPGEKPYFPVVIAKTEDVPGSPYGLSRMRDTPRFNRCLSVSYFNLAFSAKLKALALLAITSDSGDGEITADLTQLGPHSALILPKGAAAQFLSSNADLKSLLEVINLLQDLEAYVLGIPAVRAEKNLSAEGARLAAQPLTSQISELADTCASNEVRLMSVTAADAHWVVGSPATLADVKRMYNPSVRLKPAFNIESLQTRQQAITQLAKDSLIPAVDAVAEFNDAMTFEEIELQAGKFIQALLEANQPKALPAPAAPE